MIDPEESQGRAGFFLQRMAQNNPSIDLSRPIPLAKLTQEFDAMRQQMSGGGDRGGDSRGDSSNERSSPSKPAAPVTVPTFGVKDDLPLVPGFGAAADKFANIKISDEDRREAERAFGYYDRNRDGMLDQEEMSRGRGGDLNTYDKNGDGKLTPDEMALRYAQRRLERETSERQAGSVNASPGGPPGSSDGGRFGSYQPPSGGPGAGGGFGPPGFGGDRSRGPSRDGGGSGGSRSGGTSSKSTQTVGSASVASVNNTFRSQSTTERLAKLSLPSWFLENDRNQDGQVVMSEYSSRWSDEVIAEFFTYDLNRDGVITPEECVAAAKSGKAPTGSTASTTKSPTSTSSKSPTPTSSRPSVGAVAPPPTANVSTAPTTGAASPAAGAADPRYLPYAQSRIKEFDENKDGVLQPNEWSKMPKPPEGADTNGDNNIDVQEYAVFLSKR